MADTDAGFIVIDTKVSKVPLIKETLIKSDFVIGEPKAKCSRSPRPFGARDDGSREGGARSAGHRKRW